MSRHVSALLARLQEALHERRFGHHCVLKLTISLCRTICIQYVLLDYTGLHISEGEVCIKLVVFMT
jgi:hypothetical protein